MRDVPTPSADLLAPRDVPLYVCHLSEGRVPACRDEDESKDPENA